MLSHHNLVAICEQLRAHNPDNWRGSMREVFFPVSHVFLLLKDIIISHANILSYQL
jgi:long-subunit acyl-CoA synthetase (AMP-forming)